jgi:cytochrome c oxidase subunit 4
MSDHAEDIKKQVRLNIAIFVALLVLTVVTVAVSRLSTGVTTGIVIALAIATVKGSLVGGFFMHLVWEKRTIYAVLLIAGLFLIPMLGLLLWHYYDPINGTDVAPMLPAVTHEQTTESH